MRCVSTRVLPEPAPARISSGPSPCVDRLALGRVQPLEQGVDAVVGGGFAARHLSIRPRAAGVRGRTSSRPAQPVCRRLLHRKSGDRDRPGDRSAGARAPWAGLRAMGGKEALGRRWRRRSSSCDRRAAARAVGGACAHGGDLAPRSPRRSPCRAAVRHRRRARGARSAPPVQRERAADARRPAPRRRHGRAALLRSTSPPAARRSATASAPPATSRPPRLGARRGDRLGPAAAGHARHLVRAWLASPPPRDPPRPALPRRRDRRHARADRRLGQRPARPPSWTSAPARSPTLPRWRLGDSVRAHGAQIAAEARSVRIDLDALEALEPGDRPRNSTPSATTSKAPAADVADYLLVLDAINFGSGWFPTLRKRTGCSGYFTVAWEPRRPLARRRRRGRRRSCARCAPRRWPTTLGQRARPRAHGALRPGPARARRASSASAARSTSSPRPRLGAAPGRDAGRRHGDVRTTAASTSARRSSASDLALGRRRASSATSTR